MAGISPFLQNWGQGNLGATQFGNALGLNGPQGNAAAIAGFQNNPGYKFGLQQGEDAIAAQAAKGGMGASGNALLAADQFGVNYANQNWNNYISQLNPYLNYSTQGAAGIQSGYNPLAQTLNQNQNTIANMTYGADTSIGNAYANADLAKAGANANIFDTLGGAITGIAKLPLNSLGGSALAKLSDEEMKDDIERVGELYDGQPVYRYRMKGDPRHQIGLIAQEVEHFTPDAVVQFTPHVKGVDYRRATDHAAEIFKFLGAA